MVGNLLVERRIDRERDGGQHHQRMTVGRRGRDRVGGKCGGGAGLVLDQHRLAERVRQPIRIDAGDRIHAGAGGERHHDGDVLGRIAVRLRGRSETQNKPRRHRKGGETIPKLHQHSPEQWFVHINGGKTNAAGWTDFRAVAN
jgi:hypothetical protein